MDGKRKGWARSLPGESLQLHHESKSPAQLDKSQVGIRLGFDGGKFIDC